MAAIRISSAQNRTEASLREQSVIAREEKKQRKLANDNFAEAFRAVEAMTVVAELELPRNFELVYVRRRLLETALDFHADLLKRSDAASRSEQLSLSSSRIAVMLDELSAVDEMIRIDYLSGLLRERVVQVELDLTPDQLTKLRVLQQDRRRFGGPGMMGDANRRDPSGGGGDLVDEPDTQGSQGAAAGTSPSTGRAGASTRKAMVPAEFLRAMAHERNTALASILNPQQHERLKQISRQVRGVLAFNDPEVLEAIKPIESQLDIIRPLTSRLAAANSSPGHHGPGDHGPGFGDHGPGDRGPNGFNSGPDRFGGGEPGAGGSVFGDDGSTGATGDGKSAGSEDRSDARDGGDRMPNKPWDRRGDDFNDRGGGGKPAGLDPFNERLTPAAALAELLRALTPLQLKAWNALTGPPFDVSTLRTRQRMGGGGPPPMR